MSTPYDQLLKDKLSHLKMLPCLLPHIGKYYDQAGQKIMIIAESHYLDVAFNNLFTANDWHTDPLGAYNKIGNKDDQGWMNTRGVIETYANSPKISKGLLIFRNLEKAYLSLQTERKLIDECIYLNYFQRPAEVSGNTIKIHPLDSKLALENLLGLNEILKPNKIIFVSSKAYKDYLTNVSDKQKEKLPYVGSVPHPSASAWWNKASKKYGLNGKLATGREKFERIIQPKQIVTKNL